CTDGPSRWLDVHRQDSRPYRGPRPPGDAPEHRVRGFRVERGQVIGGIRLEAEQLLASASPGGSSGVRLVGCERARHDAAVAEAMEYRAPPVDLDAPRDVGVVTDHHVGTGIVRGVGDWALVWREYRRRVHDPLVQ